MVAGRVSVLGAGVMGLSTAHELALRGHSVTVIADRTAEASVSGVAAALWFPHRSGASPFLVPWLLAARRRFEQLAADRGTGVDLRPGTVVERSADADRSWTEAVPKYREATADELPPGAVAGVRAVLPVISMPHYLPWLRARCAALGVRFATRTVGRVDDLAGGAGRAGGTDLVVVAAGMRSGDLLDDDSVYPVRGQVLRLPDPGITEWITDEDHPGGLAYVVPRRGEVVCGGTGEIGSWDTAPDAGTEREILRRVCALVPALAGRPVLSRAVGLRPARDAIRLEHVPGHALPVIACYGHGGAGITLSWGCAQAVADLADRI
ncbi:D-amino-acid oxidase [Streptomyces sulfonofaciens]|uniref:D-amino-acid oxidase n=1 Tax=Streptomyces sulfonofaciens TaxID=68272 RepID=A0A919L290_9ACTN|nr:FAD-dependent oxidoreductase [Streptomyces sulfonofaciens]GHH80739.1 D-amino-acid oxidase [Streptomyces sulfonofaciens]